MANVWGLKSARDNCYGFFAKIRIYNRIDLFIID